MPVIYASTSRSLALLEVLVHIRRSDLPVDLAWSLLEIPEEWWATADEFFGLLPEDVSVSRGFGAAWHAAREAPLLKVPSAVLSGVKSPGPVEWNAVLNVEHPEVIAHLHCVETQPFKLDLWLHRLG